ncbi:hypothetical protein CsSME_00020208 [Camellia sinensis var. sinensis]
MSRSALADNLARLLMARLFMDWARLLMARLFMDWARLLMARLLKDWAHLLSVRLFMGPTRLSPSWVRQDSVNCPDIDSGYLKYIMFVIQLHNCYCKLGNYVIQEIAAINGSRSGF